jgi:hypothetical protein
MILSINNISRKRHTQTLYQTINPHKAPATYLLIKKSNSPLIWPDFYTPKLCLCMCNATHGWRDRHFYTHTHNIQCQLSQYQLNPITCLYQYHCLYVLLRQSLKDRYGLSLVFPISVFLLFVPLRLLCITQLGGGRERGRSCVFPPPLMVFESVLTPLCLSSVPPSWLSVSPLCSSLLSTVHLSRCTSLSLTLWRQRVNMFAPTLAGF